MTAQKKDDEISDYCEESEADYSDELLKEYRGEINQIDREILTLQKRREDIIETMLRRNPKGKNGNEGKGARLHQELSSFQTGLPAQEMRVACQGVAGSFSTSGANEMFPGKKVSYYEEFDGVFHAVSKGEAEIGVLPIENSYSGSVLPVYDLMKRYSFYICRCHKVRVRHCLLGRPGSEVGKIEKVYSHEQGLAQCRDYIREHGFLEEAYSNTAAAAKFVSLQEDLAIAAIASKQCGGIYDLEVLAEDIQNRQENYTRFIAITRELYLPDDANKISVCLSAPHEEGSLYRILARFAVNGLNLTKIESRPIENVNFAFMFFLEFEGNIKNNRVIKLLCQLSEELDSFTFLGNYRED